MKNLRASNQQSREFGMQPKQDIDPKKLPRNLRPGLIYFIGEINQEEEVQAIKIGYSNKADRRRRTHQCGNSNKLIELAVIPGTIADEKRLHRVLKKHHKRGEFFYPHADVYDAIRLCQEHNRIPFLMISDTGVQIKIREY